MDHLTALWAVYRRNLWLAARQPTLVAQTVILPTAILFLVAFIFGGAGDKWPVAVVDESGSPQADEILAALERTESSITPYFDLRDMPLDEAEEAVSSGRLHMLIHLPEDFASTQEVRTSVYNINTDAMKNIRLRLDHAIVTQLDADAHIHPTLAPEQPHNPWRSAYIGGSSVLLALLLGSILVAANLFAFEREHHTRTPAMLTPLGPSVAGFGHVLTAVTVAIGASLLPLAISIIVFDLEASTTRILLVYVAVLPALVGLAGAGILLGHLLKSFRTIQPLIVMAALVTYFGAGGFVGTAMLHPALQRFADVWLPSRLFGWANPVLHGFATFSSAQILGLLAAAVAGLALVFFTYRREQRLPPQPASM